MKKEVTSEKKEVKREDSKPKGWFSRRHETSGEHLNAQKHWKETHKNFKKAKPRSKVVKP